MTIAPGQTSQSWIIRVLDDNGAGVTGLVAATLPAMFYCISGLSAAAIAITLSDLAALNSAYSSGGVKEMGGGNYRFDPPNAALASAAPVAVWGEAAGKRIDVIGVADVRYVQSDARKWANSVTTVDGSGLPIVSNAAGSGAFPMIVHVTDGVNSLAGVKVSIKGSVTLDTGTTDASGNVTINENAQAVTVYCNVNGYTQTGGGSVQTINGSGNWVSSGNATLTIAMAINVVPSPPSPSQAIVLIKCVDQSGNPRVGTFIEFLAAKFATTGLAYPGKWQKTATTGSDGMTSATIVVGDGYLLRIDAGIPVPFTATATGTFNLTLDMQGKVQP